MFRNSKKNKFFYRLLSTQGKIFTAYSVDVEYFLLGME